MTELANTLSATAEPEETIRDLCGLLSVRNHQIDLSRQMDLVRQIIISNGIEFVNEVAAPFNVSFRSEGPIARTNGYRMAFTETRDVSGDLG